MHKNQASIAWVNVGVCILSIQAAQRIDHMPVEEFASQDAQDGDQVELVAIVLDGYFLEGLRGFWKFVSGAGKGVHLQLFKQLWLAVVNQVVNS